MEYEDFNDRINRCFRDISAIFVDPDVDRAVFYHVKVQDDRIGQTVLQDIRQRGLVICGINTGVNPSGSRFIKLTFDNKHNN